MQLLPPNTPSTIGPKDTRFVTNKEKEVSKMMRILELEKERKRYAEEKAAFIEQKVNIGRELAYGNI